MFIKNFKNVGSLNDIKISTVFSGIKDKSCQNDDLLWKANYCKLFIENFPDLKIILRF